MDRQSSSFITPSALFSIACVAFTVVALSSVWRNNPGPPIAPPRVAPAQVRPKAHRRQAVDSLYTETRGEPELAHASLPSRQQQITELIRLGAQIVQSLRSRLDTPAVDLLGEVSLLTTALCRLQQECSLHLATGGPAAGRAACLDAAINALYAIFTSLDTSLRCHGDNANLGNAVQQLRDQRPVLDFLLSSAHESSLPPTPPAERDSSFAVNKPNASSPSLAPPISLDSHTGITPGVDEKCWIEPPPEYSPPTGSKSPVLADEKTEPAIEEPAAEAVSPEHEDRPDDGDALYEAVNDNDTDALAELLQHGADPSLHFGELQRTPLHQAAHLNHCTCISILLRHGAVMSTEDVKGDTAVHLAAWSGNVEALSTLLAHGADLDWLSGRDGYSPLWCAVSAYQIDAARLLLKHGARVSLRAASGGGLTPLHQAAVTGQSAMCELLLDRGAQADCLDDDQNTPLHYAAASGSVSSVKVLLRSGADMEAQQVHGLTAVHWAAHKGHTEVLAALLDYGARLDCIAREGATPLHLAANRGHVAAARLLLDKGAIKKAGKANWDGVTGTPAVMAKSKGHVRLAKMLKG